MRHLIDFYWSDPYGRTVVDTGNGTRDATDEERADCARRIQGRKWFESGKPPYCPGCRICADAAYPTEKD